MGIVIKGATIRDGSGGDTVTGDLLVEGNGIRALSTTSGRFAHGDAEVIDGRGKFLMPGMTEGHAISPSRMSPPPKT